MDYYQIIFNLVWNLFLKIVKIVFHQEQKLLVIIVFHIVLTNGINLLQRLVIQNPCIDLKSQSELKN